MVGTETTIIRYDGDNKPVSVNVETGIVERPNTYYPSPLVNVVARTIFLNVVGMIQSEKVRDLILACNRASKRKTLRTFEEMQDAALNYVGGA